MVMSASRTTIVTKVRGNKWEKALLETGWVLFCYFQMAKRLRLVHTNTMVVVAQTVGASAYIG